MTLFGRSIPVALLLAALHGPSAHAGKAATTATASAGKKLTPSQYGELLIKDQKVLMRKLRTMPAAVVSLGGARITENDPVARTAQQIGYLMALHELYGRTGGGPGIMKEVPAGSKKAISEFSITGKGGHTQGINIQLPFEQALNPVIDVAHTAQEFPYRKLALYKKARGYLTFPGGYGTMDELFQFWGEKVATKSKVPLVLVDSKFWSPLVGALKQVHAEHADVISPSEWAQVKVLDDPLTIVKTMAQSKAVEKVPTLASQKRDAQSLREGMKILESMPPSITFIGEDGKYAGVVSSVAKTLTGSAAKLRVGSTGGITKAVLEGAGGKGNVYGFVRTEDPAAPAGLQVLHATADSTVHDVLMTNQVHGLVATPGGLRTLRTVFSLLTQIQTGKVPEVPVVLVGTSFWKPIFAAMKEIMLTDTRQLIKPSDLDLVTITDDPTVVAKAFGK